MADNNIELRVSVKGNNDLKEMTNLLKKAETNLSSLAKIDKAGQVTAQARNKLIKQTATELKALGYTQKQAETAALDYYNKIRQGLDSTAKADKLAHDEWAKRQRYRLTLMQNSAKMEQAEIKKLEQARLKEKQSLDRLRSSIDAEYRVKQKSTQVVKQLRDAIASKDMTRKEAIRTLQLYKQQLQATNAMQMAATKTTNRMGVVTQQAGYQISDFIVQVQGGTNPFVAFSQQASQLAGILPLMSDALNISATRLIAISAGLGVAIPLIGAIGAAFFNSRNANKEANDELETYEGALAAAKDALEEFKDAQELVLDQDLDQEYGSLAEKVRELESSFQGLNQELAKDLLTRSALNLTNSLDMMTEYEGLLQNIRIGLEALPLIGGPVGTAIIGKSPEELLNEMGLGGTVDPFSMSSYNLQFKTGNYEEALKTVQDYIDTVNKSGRKLPIIGKQFLLSLKEVTKEAIRQQAEFDGSAQAARDAEDAQKVTDDQRVAAANKVLQAKTELTRVEAEYGKLSQEAQDAAVAVAMAELERSNLGKTINAELAEQQKKVTQQGVIQEYLSDREIDSLKRQKDKTDFLDKQNYKYTQLALAEEKGGDAAVEASRRAKEEIALRNAALSAGLDITGAEYLNLIKSLRTYQDIRQANEDIVAAKELSLKASKALQTAEDKVAQEQIKTLKAQGDITKARELEVNLAKRMAYEKVLSLAKTEEEKQELMASAIEAAALAEELVKAGHATEDAKDEAKGLADALKDAERAMSSLTSFGDGLEKKLSQAKAEAVALKLGLDVGTAKDVAGLRFEAAKEYESAFTTATGSAGQVSAALEYGRALELINELEEAGYDNAAKRDSLKDKNIKSTQDEIDKLMEAVRVEETRLKVGEEEARQLEILQDLRRFNADADVKLTEKEMKAAAAKIAQMEQENQKLEEQKQMYEDLGDSIGDHFGDAIMSIVDGTETMEDAFRKMAAAIVEDLFRILVLEQAIAAFKTAGKVLGFPFLNADGNAFSNGRVIPYADGGVVASPTYFPMAGGNTGLMGEAGPEAIMPLKRGKDGKLGVQAEGGGTTIVNQTINVSTGVQQTVRTEIKSLMPQIAEGAKSAVLDAKRRGGAYGRTL